MKRPGPAFASVTDYRRASQRALPASIFDFVDGGAGDELTMNANISDFAKWRLLPKLLRGAQAQDLSTHVLGQTLSTPIMVAPTGLAGVVWPQAEIEIAEACRESGSGFIMAINSTRSMEEVSTRVPGSVSALQIFPYADPSISRRFLSRARSCDFPAICVSVDCATSGLRRREIRRGLALPPRYDHRLVFDLASKPAWCMRMVRSPKVGLANFQSESFAPQVYGGTASWDVIRQIRDQWSGYLWIKGVLRPDDSERALECGADGLIVSNHGGRQLDGAVSAIRALPSIISAVDTRVPVLVDGGFRSGYQIAVALALGATGVLVGRPILWGASVGGKDGILGAISTLTRELEVTLTLLGARTPGELDDTFLTQA